MKKFGIVTHYDVHNHGALLQLTALVRVLARMGIEAKALRFDKNYDFLGHELKAKYDVSVRALGQYLKFLGERGFGSTLYNVRKRRTLMAYKAGMGIVGDYYSESPRLDGVIVGSDEVFALHTGPTPVFFGHCLPTDSVVAYAGSFGPTTVEDVKRLHCESLVGGGLRSMRGVTVRDVNSADVVEALVGVRPEIVVDPVLLYGFGEEIASLAMPKERGYLLVYAYDNRMNSPQEVAAIKEYARKRGLKTLSPGFYHEWCDINVDVDPLRLLSYFKYADEVVTDTFHGSIMSMITQARFAVMTRESNRFKLTSLLHEYGLDNRIFEDWNDVGETLASAIDYESVNREIESRRAASMAQLNRLIALCEQ